MPAHYDVYCEIIVHSGSKNKWGCVSFGAMITIHAIGDKLPTWANDAIDNYLKRLTKPWLCQFKCYTTPTRHKNHNVKQLIEKEEKLLLSEIPKNATIITLDERGRQMASNAFAKHLHSHLSMGENIAFVLGGPDGLSNTWQERSQMTLSLSAMTLPHALARVLLVEQLYRAYTLIQQHPYHRA